MRVILRLPFFFLSLTRKGMSFCSELNTSLVVLLPALIALSGSIVYALLMIATRALQGFGGGIAQPLGPAQLYRAFPPKEQGTALGYFGIVLVFAPALGPVLGGWLVDANLWRLIFFINSPVGVIGVLLGRRSAN